jgi:hypothetical protein
MFDVITRVDIGLGVYLRVCDSGGTQLIYGTQCYWTTLKG